jgi:hypothetical protein
MRILGKLIFIIPVLLVTGILGNKAYQALLAQRGGAVLQPKSVDLSGDEVTETEAPAQAAAPSPTSLLPDMPSLPTFGHKAVLVELTFARQGGKAFSGAYRIADEVGHMVASGDTRKDGNQVSLILSPGRYEVQVPANGYSQKIELSNGHGERQHFKIVVAPKR